MNLGEKGKGGLVVGDAACDGDELALLDLSLEGHLLLDGGVGAGARGGHRIFG